MTSISEEVARVRRDRIVSMENFVEEQNVRNLLGPQIWRRLSAELVSECRNICEVQAGLVLHKSSELSFTARNTETARALTLR